MKLLLDTHSFLWFVSGDPKLSVQARSLIGASENEIFLSTASLWEIAIKSSLGKLNLAKPFEVLIPQQLNLNQIELLNITIAHTAFLTTLPFHHRDPFDRLLIAQSHVEDLPMISRDSAFDSYSIKRLW